ncbi:AAA family ATPase [Pseudomonas entomophila]|uniref:McrB family protein n=1 Tax=Pseudomonas entomophila TaxID=312306 RepID=UPI0023D856D4|nr:AAA family ATPase [Pseudomonas entomophila]MDF0732730.1 AAA family ATPase [Pseudomonas entomophila]
MSRFNPHYPDAADVFAIAEHFKHRCLLDQYSLFLDGEQLWTPQRFNALVTHYVKQPDLGAGKFYDKLAVQLATCEAKDVALMAEVFWIFQLPAANLTPLTKLRSIERIWNIKPAAPFPRHSQFLAHEVLAGLGSAGPGYNQYMWVEMAFAIEAFAELLAKPREERQGLLADGLAFAEWLDSIPSARGRQFYHTLCHVLFPDLFERIFSQNHKYKAARAHHIWQAGLGDDRPRLDMALLDLRNRLEAQHAGEIDHYEDPVGTLIKEDTAKLGDPVSLEPLLMADDEDPLEQAPATPVRREADNLILFGPPGTGKTHQMQARMEQAFARGEVYEFVAFHPSYAYEDFVGGLRPEAAEDGNGVIVRYHKGPLLTLCEKAHANPTQQFTLFIDEINRANVAKVFGELITLIEPSKRVIAGSKDNEGDNGLWVRLPGLAERFAVPDNLNVVATMNTADRSIAMMDIALRRRFRFQECPPEPDQITPASVGSIELPRLLRTLNDRLEYLLDRDHTLGHALFMGIESLQRLREVLAQQVIPLLQEYFFDDLHKVRLVLTGGDRDSVFFSARPLSAERLFPGARPLMDTGKRLSYSLGDPSNWSEPAIRALYDGSRDAAHDAHELS